MFIFKDFIYLFLDRGEGKEKERERNITVWLALTRPPLGTWPLTQACALTGNQTSGSFGSQAGIQSTEPHQPGQFRGSRDNNNLLFLVSRHAQLWGH